MGDKITITTDQAKTTHQFRIKCSILRDVKERTSYTGAPARALIVFYYNICHYFIHEKCIQNWNKIYVHFMFYETYGKQYLFLVNNSRSFHKLFIFRVQELHTSSLTIVKVRAHCMANCQIFAAICLPYPSEPLPYTMPYD